MPGIIKAHRFEQPREGVHPVAFNFDDVTVRAEQYLDEVRKQAEQIIQQAKAEAETIRQHATQEGRQAGIMAVDKMLDEKLAHQVETLLPALRQAIEQVEQAKQAWLQQWESQAIHVTAAIAEKVIRRELTDRPEITLDLIRETLELATGGTKMKLHLNPDDHETLGTQAAAIAHDLAQLAPADVVADPSVDRGGCRVVTEFGEIDQRIQSQLARIEQELT